MLREHFLYLLLSHDLAVIFPFLASIFQLRDVPILLALVAMEVNVVVGAMLTETAILFNNA